jgi:myo-inositol 2-dehydrogenase/D-chiro-inositol 1-dehydrogenase
MSENLPQPSRLLPSRRDFIKTSAVVAAGTSLLGSLNIARAAHAFGDDTIKIGLIGCGGRGSGAAKQALSTEGKVKLVAVGDAFADRLEGSLKGLQNQVGDRVDVPKERQFVGFDAYQKVLDSGVDLVILATPPGFRPIHFKAAVDAGKHVFMEKPVATDPAGVRQVLAATKVAKEKGLGVGVGLQRRHHAAYIETIKQLQDGAIGDILAARVYWNGSTPWVKKREDLEKKEGRKLTEMEYQMRNWYYFTWLCGDHIVEQHIHNMDVINWLKGKAPMKANGMGGCEVRKGADYGETFDHHCVEFEYDDGTRMFSQCRHIPGCWNSVTEFATGTKGQANIAGGSFTDLQNKETWQTSYGRSSRSKKYKDPYQVEHDDLFASIRSGNPLNEGEYGAMSSMTAILGRMATYSGKEITMEKALNSQIALVPSEFGWDVSPPVASRAVPGQTQVV